MSRHAFIDESTRGRNYLICAATISPADLHAARRALTTMRAPGQRRIHFATESDQRRRSLLKEMSTLETTSVVYVANHRDQVAARAAIVATAVVQLRQAGVSRLVLEARQGQDEQDRAVIYRALGPRPGTSIVIHAQPLGQRAAAVGPGRCRLGVGEGRLMANTG